MLHVAFLAGFFRQACPPLPRPLHQTHLADVAPVPPVKAIQASHTALGDADESGGHPSRSVIWFHSKRRAVSETEPAPSLIYTSVTPDMWDQKH